MWGSKALYAEEEEEMDGRRVGDMEGGGEGEGERGGEDVGDSEHGETGVMDGERSPLGYSVANIY